MHAKHFQNVHDTRNLQNMHEISTQKLCFKLILLIKIKPSTICVHVQRTNVYS